MRIAYACRALLVTLLLVVPRLVYAQGGVLGSIVGNVFDQTGQPLSGVKVVAESPTQIGGVRVTYTNPEGGFRFNALQPGTFSVIASAPRMTSVHQKAIKVGTQAPSEVTLLMEVATATEEVKVIEKAPIVSTTTANVKEQWDEEFIDNLPLETRTSVEELVGHSTPGANYAGERLMRVRGGNTQQNLFLVDGFNMSGFKTLYKSVSSVEVSTAGYGADGAIAPGGLVSMVTKGGSNKFELDVNGFHEDSLLRAFTESSDQVPRDWRMYINPNFSGPIIKDKLWFFVNGEARDERYSREPDPNGFFPQRPTQHYWNYRATTKLTYQISPRNKLQHMSFWSWDWSRNRDAAPGTDDDAQRKRERTAFYQGLTFESLVRDNLFFKSQIGFGVRQEGQSPQSCLIDEEACQNTPALVQTRPQTLNLRNWNTLSLDDIKQIEFVNEVQWFLNSKLLGDHAIKLQSRYYTQGQSIFQGTPGDRVVQYAGSTPDRQTLFYSNDPRFEPERFGYAIFTSTGTRFTNFIQDAARVTRYWTITPGVAVTSSSSSNSRGQTATDGISVTPHVSTAWDATHDGRTVLRGSFNQYVDPDVGRLARHSLGTRVTKQCLWDAAAADRLGNPEHPDAFTGDCRYSGGVPGATVGLPCGPNGIDENGNSCRQKLKIPRTTEYTVGAEREVVPGLGLGLDFVYRDFRNPYSTKETNRVWNRTAAGLEPTGAYRNGRAETIVDLETPAEARRKYQGVTFAAHKREGTLKISASYTWSQTYGNAFDTENNAWGDIPPRDLFLWGYMPDDARHVIKTTLNYRFTPWLSCGVLYQYRSGTPYNRWYYNASTGAYDVLRARVGVNPGTNINDPGDDRDLRLPDIQSFNVQLRANLRPVLGTDLELWSDVQNVLALRTTTSVITEDGPRFGLAEGRMGPTLVRLGFRFRY
jgi:hypothetical protein